MCFSRILECFLELPRYLSFGAKTRPFRQLPDVVGDEPVVGGGAVDLFGKDAIQRHLRYAYKCLQSDLFPLLEMQSLRCIAKLISRRTRTPIFTYECRRTGKGVFVKY